MDLSISAFQYIFDTSFQNNPKHFDKNNCLDFNLIQLFFYKLFSKFYQIYERMT